ncbi:MAG: D-alanine--D-alanine ligase family protein [Bacteriovoracaceae bacterium]
MKTILIFGGNSDEKLVSAASAQNLCSQFSFAEIWFVSDKSEIHLVSKAELLLHERPFERPFIPATPSLFPLVGGLQSAHTKVFFLAFHGKEGEDGTIQRILENEKIPFTGSGSYSSALSFDKIQAKKRVIEEKIPCAPELKISNEADLRSFFQTHKKIVVKPVANGSSVGLHILSSNEELEKVLPLILNSPFEMMAEKFLIGRELTVGVRETVEGKLEVLPPSEVLLTGANSFDFKGKYLGRGTTEITPAVLTDSEKKSLQDMALAAHQALGCYGYSRTDIILTTDGPVYLETNTLPGLTKASFIPQQLAVLSISMADFIKGQLTLAMQRYSS